MQFKHYTIKKLDDGYEVILYLEDQTEEFSSELGDRPDDKKRKSLETEAEHFIRDKFPNFKVKMVKIMGGSLLVTTLAFAPIESKSVEAATPDNGEEQQEVYTVKQGDTLWSIANRFHTTVNAIKQHNQLTSDTLQIGQPLLMPNGPSSTRSATDTETTTYTVVSGDTLSQIAAKNGTTVHAIKAANNLTNDFLSIGQTLSIPSGTTTVPTPTESTSEVETTTYTVVSGDTLSQIAAKYGTTVHAIKSENNLTNDFLSIGQTLSIPSGTTTAPTPTESPSEGETTTYTVVSGDTLSGIAAKYGTTVHAIKSANNLTSDFLRIGQSLTIPSGTTSAPKVDENNTTTYIVVSGDTLSGIAAKYGTTVQAIQNANNLTNDFLRIGQSLQIPTSNQVTNDRSIKEVEEATYSQEDLEWLAKMIYAEARGESLEGQVAVGAVILNRVNSELFPNSIEEVIFENSHGHYQFSPAGNGALEAASPNDTSYEAANRALRGEDPTNGSLFFYNPDKTNDQWVRSRTVSTTIGNHVFAH
ncbi:LysM peptidoglycan-binding domain-containing protein [Bacillus shivajii]|uniref:LysM peptidoglycan-binding domain-containing protein n=1 Tax=Bacillus shivajii TaxID=1983719 RepID=UPI001CFB02C6|nr:LysM peptidoglycan-binding domain-containing protein [Bacillus shivajii]UCZ51405.1 LysM peptidoglycan-binding domain-containing protein [Bacillus shivajii]